ncbi:MAG: aldehyde dehydrogenase family protein [candidate division WOR-3 bacterium]
MEEKVFICGKWVDGKEYFEVRHPYDGKTLWKFPSLKEEDVNRAIEFLEKNKKILKEMPKYKRAEILENAKNIIEKKKEEFAKTISLECGKTIKEARLEVERGIETLIYSFIETKNYKEEVVPFDSSRFGEKRIGFYIREPLGVVGIITPFNFPLNLALHKIAPAIGCGNSIVFKPASYTPKVGKMIVETLLEAGLPPECIAFLTGSGSVVGESIVKNDYVKKISFTGSLEVGERISQIAKMKRITLELGSNSACIVFKDAEWEKYLERMVRGAYALAGQVCISVQRIYVEEEIYEEFCDKYLEKVKTLKVGDPLKEDTDVGPMIDEASAIRAQEWLKEAEENGAEILPEIKREGSILYPCIVKNAREDLKVCQKEAFAPLVVINTFKDEDEAIFKVNNSIYGLQCGIFTKDIKRAFKFFKEIEVGGVIINDVPTYRVDLMPYGGVKGSGVGREGPHFAFNEFSEIKLIVFNLD